MRGFGNPRNRKEVRPSFLKKRSKKLLFNGLSLLSTGTLLVERSETPGNKSFLLLFFKKEGLTFLLLSLSIVFRLILLPEMP